jgi:hypothetical protein
MAYSVNKQKEKIDIKKGIFLIWILQTEVLTNEMDD